MNVYCSDDYAGMDFGIIEFYYGYEHTVNDGIDEEDDEWNDDDEWCFVASRDGKEFARFTMTELDNSTDSKLNEPMKYVMAGIGVLIKRGIISLNI